VVGYIKERSDAVGFKCLGSRILGQDIKRPSLAKWHSRK